MAEAGRRGNMRNSIAVIVATVALAGCATKPDLPVGAQAYAIIPAPVPDGAVRNYRIGPLDTIAINVFQEPDLSVKDVSVDAGGNVILPLIGEIRAGGHTSSEFGRLVADRLRGAYLKDPQVSIIVQDSASQKVTVEGSVTEPGVYSIKGRTTLLDALAMAKGTSRVAALDQVVVFRDINGQRMGALFDVKKIQRGETADPEILGNDSVVVGLSFVKAAWRDVLTAAPLVIAFRPLI